MQQVFLGNEQMTLDDKGRVGIPARFMSVLRAICPDQADTLGVMITPDRSIKLMPAPYFAREIERWQALNDQVDEERMVLNLSTSMAELLALDKQNRIKLNPLMQEVCQLDRQVVIVGNLGYMQLFALKVWREMFERGLPQWGAASTRVARKDEPKAPVQYVINAGGGEPTR
ncbi:MAG: hypothetical protein M1457_03085 [bacterium]|nr:hypothetical protein [bacterium]